MFKFMTDFKVAVFFSRLFDSQPRQYPVLPFSLGQDSITRLWWMSGLFLLAVMAILIPAYYFDPRLLNGAPIWAKPIKFSLSLAIHFFTLAILAQQLDVKHRTGIVLTLFGYAAVASMLIEQLYISIQAGRGRSSHFNLETGFEASMYSLMGVAAVFLVLISFLLGVMIWRYGNKKDTSKGFFLGSIIGLIVGSILTLLLAGYMSSGTSHLVGEAASDANGLPLLGWSRTAGDLRISHFLATHLIQILPLIGWLCDHRQLPARKIVWVSSLVLISICVALFFVALSGRPLF
jgi:hypothetical protein